MLCHARKSLPRMTRAKAGGILLVHSNKEKGGFIMTRVSHRTGVEEKGQRSLRSSDVYLPKRGLEEKSLCKSCGALYHNKRWYMDEAELKMVRGEAGINKVVCPACQRIEDGNPAGIVTLSGSYVAKHARDIINAAKHVEAKSMLKNPLGRIMEVKEEQNIITIATTEDKLAQKVGREIYKAHHGELHYQWSHEENFVRVNWKRE